MVGSLYVVRKIFPYVNMCVDHVMPCRIRRYASPLVGVIRRSGGEMHPSASRLHRPHNRHSKDFVDFDDANSSKGVVNLYRLFASGSQFPCQKYLY